MSTLSQLKEFDASATLARITDDSRVSRGARSAFDTLDTVDVFEPASSTLSLDPSCGAYNEDAFRYFLEIERARAEVSARPLLLLLIDLKSEGTREHRMPAATADKLFASLSLCLRDTDFIGWYRDGRVAGAVLTQHSETSDARIPDLVAQRVSAALQGSLSPELSIRVQVRVYHLPAPVVS